jgi:hypothetical protein
MDRLGLFYDPEVEMNCVQGCQGQVQIREIKDSEKGSDRIGAKLIADYGRRSD